MEWVKIKDYDNYSVNEIGEVRNDKSGRILKWRLDKKGYYRISLCKNGKVIYYLIHRLIALHFIPNPNNYPFIDHININPSDNSIDNLRWCSRSQNNRNIKKKEGTTSRFRGVYFHKPAKKWMARCRLNGKNKYLGYFETEIEAAETYDNFVRDNNLEDFSKINIV